MIFLSSVISLKRFTIFSSASFLIWVSPSAVAMVMFVWYQAVFDVNWDYQEF